MSKDNSLVDSDEYTITFKIKDKGVFNSFVSKMFDLHMKPEYALVEVGASVSSLGYGDQFKEVVRLSDEVKQLEKKLDGYW